MNEEKEKALRALKTARGQIDGIVKMIEDERYCMDISNQIAAAQALVKKSQVLILKQHLDLCIKNALEDGTLDEKNNEIMKLIERMIL